MTTIQPTSDRIAMTGKGAPTKDEPGNREPTPWSEAEKRLARGGWFWLTTVRPDVRPHVMPILALWSDGALYFCSKDSARKSRNLATNPECVITTDAGDLHLVVEGTARRVVERPILERTSAAFERIYDWPTVVAGDKLDAESGAPTSGGPPYDVFEVTPTKVFGLPAQPGTFTPTRWRF
jgi:hypothetical protein